MYFFFFCKSVVWLNGPVLSFFSFITHYCNAFSASGANGAIIHYKPEPSDCSVVDANKLFLLDSGAQYVDGTTDITRTVHFGEPTTYQKECFTRVLQVWNLHLPLFCNNVWNCICIKWISMEDLLLWLFIFRKTSVRCWKTFIHLLSQLKNAHHFCCSNT